MPKFELLSLAEAEIQSSTGKRAEITREYLGYIEELGEGQAGRLTVAEGETSGAVRRRLGAASKLSGKNLIIKRVGSDIFFWARPTRRRGRPPKNA